MEQKSTIGVQTICQWARVVREEDFSQKDRKYDSLGYLVREWDSRERGKGTLGKGQSRQHKQKPKVEVGIRYLGNIEEKVPSLKKCGNARE